MGKQPSHRSSTGRIALSSRLPRSDVSGCLIDSPQGLKNRESWSRDPRALSAIGVTYPPFSRTTRQIFVPYFATVPEPIPETASSS